MQQIYNLDPYLTNERNGTYGGQAGEKEGITIDGTYWIVKYPKSTKGMRGDVLSYMTAPLSEYITMNSLRNWKKAYPLPRIHI